MVLKDWSWRLLKVGPYTADGPTSWHRGDLRRRAHWRLASSGSSVFILDVGVVGRHRPSSCPALAPSLHKEPTPVVTSTISGATPLRAALPMTVVLMKPSPSCCPVQNRPFP